jgi:inorganic pyrophosphatase
MEITVIVEIPKGTRNKYEADDDGNIWLDRHLFTATQYPEDYGFVPGTLAEDGDPLDAMVMLQEPTFPGCHIKARPVGVFRMKDEEGVDAKLLCVPATDPRSQRITELDQVDEHILAEVAHFFEIYKALEPGKGTEPGGWQHRHAAERAVEAAREAYQKARASKG